MFERCEFISSTDSCNLSSFSTVVASGASVFSKISESILISVRCKASCSCSVVEGRREITRAMTVRTVLSRLKNLSKVIFECLESLYMLLHFADLWASRVTEDGSNGAE